MALSRFLSDEQRSRYEQILSNILTKRVGTQHQVMLYCSGHTGRDRREGVPHHTEDLAADFGLSPSVEFIQYTVGLAAEGTDHEWDGEFIFALPEQSAEVGLWYNIYLPGPLRGYGLGRLYAAVAFDIIPCVDQLLAFPASYEGRRLLKAFGGIPVAEDGDRHEWWEVQPAAWA